MIRGLALDIVLDSAKGGRFVDRGVDDTLARERLEPRDASLLRAIALGSVRHRATLDAVVRAFARDGTLPRAAVLREILRQALFQMLFLDRVPDHAAVHAAVELVQTKKGKGMSGFVNGVLRSVGRSVRRVPAEGGRKRNLLPRPGAESIAFDRPVFVDPVADTVGYLAAVYSHPAWLVARWCDRFGDERCEALLAAGNRVPETTLRVRGGTEARDRWLGSLSCDAAPGSHPDSVRLLESVRVEELPGYAEGEFLVQGEAAMEVGRAVEALPGETVLEVGAAPGGKTVALAESVGEAGRVLATDISTARLGRLRENIARLALDRVFPLAVAAEHLARALSGPVDHVLLDVPCSNTAVLSRRPEARYRVTASSIAELAELQGTMVAAAAALVRPGGSLVYSTCSIESEENEAIPGAVLPAMGFSLERECLRLPGEPYADGGYHARWRRDGG